MAVATAEEEYGSGLFNSSASNSSSLQLCAAEALDGPHTVPVPGKVLLALRIAQLVYNLVILILSLALNTVIVWIPIKDKSLQTMDMAIAVQVALLNLLLTVLEIPSSIVNASTGDWVLGIVPCITLGSLITVVFSIRRLMMLTLSADRFLLVFCTFSYPKHHLKVTLSCSIAAWTFATLSLVPGLPGLMDCYTVRPSRTACFYDGLCSTPCSRFGYVLFLTTILPSYIIPSLLFGALYLKGRKSLATTGQTDEGKERIKKSTITFFWLFVAYSLVTIPGSGVYMITLVLSRVHEYSTEYEVIQLVSSQVKTVLVVLDAIVIMRNRDIKEAVMKVYHNIKAILSSRCH